MNAQSFRDLNHYFRKLPLLESGILIALLACGMFSFFGPVFASHFHLYPGDLGDWRFNAVIVEHWYSVLKGQAEWRSPIFFFPAKGVLGFSDSLLLFVPFYVPFRIIGLQPSLAFVFCFMSILSFGFMSTYWFMSRTLSFPKLISFGVSYAFVFSSMVAIRYPHAQLFTFSFLPSLFILGVRFAESVLVRRPALLSGIGFSVGLAAILDTGFYIGYFVLLFISAFVPFFLLLNTWFSWFSTRDIFLSLQHAYKILFACVGSFFIALTPFLLTYLPTHHELPGGSPWSDVECQLPLPHDLINVAGNGLWSWVIRMFRPEAGPCSFRAYAAFERTFGIPIITLTLFALSCVWLGWTYARTYEESRPSPKVSGSESEDFKFRIVFALAATVLFWWVIMLRLPWGSLWHIVYLFYPGASSLRAIFRFQIVLNFFIIIVIGFSLSRIVTTWPKYFARIFLAVAVGGMVIEQYNTAELFFSGMSHSNQLDRIVPPPTNCRQFFVDPETVKSAPSYVASLDAVVIAQRLGLPTLNGYSGYLPPMFHIPDFADPTYLDKVGNWASTHKIVDGLCMLDLKSNLWVVLSKSLDEARQELFGANLLLPTKLGPLKTFVLSYQGFWSQEPGGTWTNGDAWIEFETPLHNVKSIIVSGHRGFAGQNVTIVTAGNNVIVDPAAINFHVEFGVTQPIAKIEIISDSFTPSAMGMGPDSRKLGVFLETVLLKH